MAQPEFKLQLAACQLLRLAYPDLLWWSVPNGGFILDRRTVAKLKATGLRPGASDLMVLLPGGRLGCLEAKSAIGKQTPEQMAFAASVEARGGFYAIFRTLEALEAILASWGVSRGRRAA